MPKENKRLLIELERAMREINRDTLNPLFDKITPGEILPIMEMVAHARGNYLKELFKLSQIPKEKRKINTELVKSLHLKRLIYDELIAAYQALDIAIEHGYLDVGHKK